MKEAQTKIQTGAILEQLAHYHSSVFTQHIRDEGDS